MLQFHIDICFYYHKVYIHCCLVYSVSLSSILCLEVRQNAQEVLKSFGVRLVQTLPMQDAYFIAELNSAGLLPGNMKAKVLSLSTSACRADSFMDEVIIPDVENNTTNLYKLLAVMGKFNNDAVKNLAAEIQKALH